MSALTKDRLVRGARLYANNGDAARALGINLRSFSRLCRQHGIETPHARRLRENREAEAGDEGESA